MMTSQRTCTLSLRMRFAASVFVFTITACGAQAPREKLLVKPVPSEIPIDHIIIGIDSLERGMGLLEEATGVRPQFGGNHPGRGTRNALMSLGAGRYLELMAPNPADSLEGAARGATGRERYFSHFHQLTPIGWAVHVDDAAMEVARLRSAGLPAADPVPGARARPNGATLRWNTIDPWGEDRDVLPFVIAWSADTPHPSSDAPQGCTLADLHIATPAADSIRELLSRAGWPVIVAPDQKEQLKVTLQCPRGRIELP